MDRLPHDPKNLRELVEADLRRAARLIIKIQDEIDPQIRIATPEGDYWIAVTLPADPYGRKVILRNLSLFMAWKQALGFTLASELYDPDSVYCAGVFLKSATPALRASGASQSPGRRRISATSNGCRKPPSIRCSLICCRVARGKSRPAILSRSTNGSVRMANSRR